jgi:type IV secretory pathway VirJ component
VAPGKAGERLVFVITGEGGRTPFEATLASDLAAAGSGVLVLDAKAYLATARTPDEAAREVEATIRRYATEWKRPRLVIVGHSRGADIAPFVANRLATDLRQQLDAVVMLDPGGRATFALSLRDVVSKKPRPTDSPVMPELERLRGTRVICAYSRQEPAAFCPRVDSTLVRVVLRSGGRTLRSADSRPIAQLITERNGP